MEAYREKNEPDKEHHKHRAESMGERFFSAHALDIATTAIGYLDKRCAFQEANNAMVELLSMPKESIIGKTFAELGSTYSHIYAATRLVVKTKRPHKGRLAFRAPGTEHDTHCAINIQPDTTESGEIRGLLVEAFDISEGLGEEEKLSEERRVLQFEIQLRTEELLENRERLEAIIAASPLAIYTLDPNATVQMWNQAAERIFGWKDTEVVGGRLPNIPAGVLEDPSSAIRRELRGEAFAGIETRRLRKDGTFIDVSVSAAPLHNQSGDFVGTMAILEDITERKRMEKAIKEVDRAIRQVYVDVTGAVTGGKLVLMTPEEIKAALGEPVSDERYVTTPKELAGARQYLKETLIHVFPEILDLTGFIDPFGEALTNAVKHANGGWYRLFRKGNIAQIVVSDGGPGIDFKTLPKATLQSGYSSVGTLGRGFSVMLGRCDRVLLATQPGNTTVVLEIVVTGSV